MKCYDDLRNTLYFPLLWKVTAIKKGTGQRYKFKFKDHSSTHISNLPFTSIFIFFIFFFMKITYVVDNKSYIRCRKKKKLPSCIALLQHWYIDTFYGIIFLIHKSLWMFSWPTITKQLLSDICKWQLLREAMTDYQAITNNRSAEKWHMVTYQQ